MVIAPNCGALSELNFPLKQPIGARQPPVMTTSSIVILRLKINLDYGTGMVRKRQGTEGRDQLFIERRNSRFDSVPRIFSSTDSIASTVLKSERSLRSTQTLFRSSA